MGTILKILRLALSWSPSAARIRSLGRMSALFAVASIGFASSIAIAPTFDRIKTGTNSTATMTCGTGCTVTISGTGVNNANDLNGTPFAGTSGDAVVFGAANIPVDSKVAITIPATGSTLTIADGKTETFSKTLTFAGTDGTTETFPPTSATIARTDAGQTFTGSDIFSSAIQTPSFVGNFAGANNTIPWLCAVDRRTAQSGTLTAIALQCNGARAPAGTYLLMFDMYTTSGQSGTGNVTFTANFTAEGTGFGGSTTAFLNGALSLNALGTAPGSGANNFTQSGSKVIESDGTADITYTITYTATGQFDSTVTLVRLR